MTKFSGKAGIIQRVLPNYRVPFFNALGRACENGLGVFAGKPKQSEMIKSVNHLDDAQLTIGKNMHILKGPLYLCIQIGLLNWLPVWDPDVLIMEANPRYLRSKAAIRWMHQRKRPVIGWGLGAPPIPDSPIASLRKSWRAQFIRQFDTLITYSQIGASQYAQLGFPERQIFVAVNAVTPSPPHPLPERSTRPGEKLRILFVGRLQPRKNLDNLLRACARLPGSHQPEFVIVGDGPDRAHLENLANKLYPNTIFTGALYDQALARQFRDADLFVLPGTGGLAIQQAMSYGLPIIAAEADGTQEDLVRPQNGWQLPPNDIAALTTTLQKALSDIAALRKMGAESYRIVAEEINLEQMVAVFIKALNRSTG